MDDGQVTTAVIGPIGLGDDKYIGYIELHRKFQLPARNLTKRGLLVSKVMVKKRSFGCKVLSRELSVDCS